MTDLEVTLKMLNKANVIYTSAILDVDVRHSGCTQIQIEANEVDIALKLWLDTKEIAYTYVEADDNNKAKYVMNHLKLIGVLK